MIKAEGTPAQAAFPPDKETSNREPIMKAPDMAVVAMACETLNAKRARRGLGTGMG